MLNCIKVAYQTPDRIAHPTLKPISEPSSNPISYPTALPTIETISSLGIYHKIL
jgi:hypothetical protein